jgi:hypothetical protein
VYVAQYGAAGVEILLLEPLAALWPTEFVALTVKVYAVLALNPEIVIVPEPAVANVPVIPPGLEVAVYSVIVAPPLLAGAVYETVADEYVTAVAVPIVGAPGTVAATAAVALEFALVEPTVFVPVTTQRIAFPASAATST